LKIVTIDCIIRKITISVNEYEYEIKEILLIKLNNIFLYADRKYLFF